MTELNGDIQNSASSNKEKAEWQARRWRNRRRVLKAERAIVFASFSIFFGSLAGHLGIVL